MQNDITEIDVKSGPGVFRHYEHLDLRPWYCLGEYVDNAIGSMESNIKSLKQRNPDYILTVRIFRDTLQKKIYITDNAAGIAEKDLMRAFWIGERPDDTSGANEYGVGMKMASFHFGSRWSVRTSAIGEPIEKYIDLDVDKIENSGSTVVDVQRESKSADSSYTEVCIESFYENNWPRGKSITKIKEFLGSMYRRYIDEKKLILIFDEDGDSETIAGNFPSVLNMHFVEDKDKINKEWKQEILFNYENKKISGWVGLLAKTGGGNAGFDLIRRNKIIEGSDNSWKPGSKDSSKYDIFGGSHSNAQSRLFGELVFTGFHTNNNKSRIRWNDDDVKELFLEYLHDLIKIDSSTKLKSKKSKLREFWFQLENYLSYQKDEKRKLIMI